MPITFTKSQSPLNSQQNTDSIKEISSISFNFPVPLSTQPISSTQPAQPTQPVQTNQSTNSPNLSTNQSSNQSSKQFSQDFQNIQSSSTSPSSFFSSHNDKLTFIEKESIYINAQLQEATNSGKKEIITQHVYDISEAVNLARKYIAENFQVEIFDDLDKIEEDIKSNKRTDYKKLGYRLKISLGE